jgi:hypothetical protein
MHKMIDASQGESASHAMAHGHTVVLTVAEKKLWAIGQGTQGEDEEEKAHRLYSDTKHCPDEGAECAAAPLFQAFAAAPLCAGILRFRASQQPYPEGQYPSSQDDRAKICHINEPIWRGGIWGEDRAEERDWEEDRCRRERQPYKPLHAMK